MPALYNKDLSSSASESNLELLLFLPSKQTCCCNLAQTIKYLLRFTVSSNPDNNTPPQYTNKLWLGRSWIWLVMALTRGTDQVITAMTAEQTRSAHMCLLTIVYIH